MVDGVGISSGLVGDDALAASLVPRVFGAPGSNVFHFFGGAAVAGGASSGGTVATAGVGENEGEEEGKGQDLHVIIGLLINL